MMAVMLGNSRPAPIHPHVRVSLTPASKPCLSHQEAETSSKTAPTEQRRPEDSVYYHPKLNPLGLPPPGKAQRWVTPAGNAPAAAVAKPKLTLEDIPLPDPPPLPPGPPPVLPPPPAPKMPVGILCPPPPGVPILPPPPGPPPGHAIRGPVPHPPILPPPPGPPPRLSPFPGPQIPPGGQPPPFPQPPGVPRPTGVPSPLPPPPGPPPSRPPGHAKPAPQAVIQGKSTVVSLPRAHEDKAVTSMVPASLLVQRPKAAAVKPKPKPVSSAGFGLLPRTVAAGTAAAAAAPKPVAPAAKAPNLDAKYDDFMASLRDMGAL